MNLESAVLKTRDVIRLRHLSLKTEESYLAWLCRFSRFVSERCRDGRPEVKMESFLTQLAKPGVAASTQNQAFCALQAAMGHKQLETTMGYLHAESLSVHSPLDP